MLASSGGPLVSQSNRAHWNDANSACLLEFCIQQREAGTYNGTVMSGEGYQAVIDGLLARRGLVYSRLQVKNQIVVLKNTYTFWRYMQVHTGLGRKPDGTIDADSEFWITHTEVHFSLRLARCDSTTYCTYVSYARLGCAYFGQRQQNLLKK